MVAGIQDFYFILFKFILFLNFKKKIIEKVKKKKISKKKILNKHKIHFYQRFILSTCKKKILIIKNKKLI